MKETALRELIDATPACAISARLEAVLSCCGRSGCEQIVIVDEHQCPIGLLKLGRLLLKLAAPAPVAIGGSAEPACSQAIATGDVRIAVDILEPLRLLPLSTTLAELKATDGPCALVDAEGRYWGLVDRLRVLQLWVSHAIADPILSTWENLIDQLPLPLKLQTESGEVIGQNQLWQAEADPGLERKIAIAVPSTETLWLVAQEHPQPEVDRLVAKNADLVQLNRLKDEFLACISHELKSPLTAILGLSSLLKDQSIGSLSDRQLRYAQLIHQSGRHLSSIVHNILDLTRCETGQLTLTPEPLAIAPLCRRAYEQARQIVLGEIKADRPADIDEPQFELSIAPEVINIIADELRLRQMLTHLLSNALKFAPGGKVTLTVEAWDDWIAFTVTDTGIGIAADQQHLIFQKFQQLENPLTRRFAGTGLGLAITQRLARLHGGEVSFTSMPSCGSRFTLLLPPVPAAAAAAARSRSPNLALVVEAVPSTIATITAQLGSLGYRTAIARSGPEAIAKARQLQPAVILLNPVLPLLSGWDVLTLLKTQRETQHIPVMVMTIEAEKSQAKQHKADGFLSLPIQIAALQKVLPQSQSQERSITILHLRLGQPPHDLSRVVYPHHLLEVEDIEQADLLARVWRPDAIVLDADRESIALLPQISKYSTLAALPIVTLTPAVTQAANQTARLTVFPCLTSIANQEVENPLLQVLKIATGQVTMPRLLLADLAADPCAQTSDRLAIAQHLQAAGFHSTISQTWAETARQIANKNLDLLLLWLPPQGVSPEIISALMQLQPLPPILLLHDPIASPTTYKSLLALASITIATLPATTTMSELVAHIRQASPEGR